MRKIVFISGLVAVLALTGMHINRVAAIESSGIGALPAHPRQDNPRTKSIFVYTINPNESITDGIKVINNTDNAKTLAVYPVDSQISSDGAFACTQMADPSKEVGSWIKLDQDKVTLPANSSQTIPFSLTVPGDVKAGEHNGCIVVQDVDQTLQKAGNGIVLNFRSALRVAVTIPGELRTDISFVSVQSRNLNTKMIEVSPTLQNTGNVSADTHIDVKLTGIFGFHFTATSINGQFPILPGSQSRFNFEVKKPFWGGWYIRDVQANYRKPLPSGQLGDDVTNIKAEKAIIFTAPQPLALVIEIAAVLVLVGLMFYVPHRLWLRRLRLISTMSYVVQEGDTVDSISGRFHVKWKQLAKINNLKSPYNIHTGQVINVPSASQKAGAAEVSSDVQKPHETEPPDSAY